MLYNKNNVRKTNDKKILHKVGKQWKVVSVALLMAIGGTAAVATHANAQSTNANNNNNSANAEATVSKNDMAHHLQGPVNVAPKSVAPKSANSASAKSSAITYLHTEGGSAASANAAASQANVSAKSNANVVNSYVKSLNAKFPTVTNALTSSAVSANNAARRDNANAHRYSAMANNSAVKSAVSSVASKAGYTVDDYANYVVKPGATTYSLAVSNAAGNVNALKLASSLAGKLLLANGSLANDASEASVNAVNASVNAQIASAQHNVNATASANVSTAASTNASALQSATVESIYASANARGQMASANSINAGSASSVVAKYANNNNAAVSSAVNSYATSSNYAFDASNKKANYVAPQSYNISGSALTNANNSSAFNDMKQLVSNAYALNAYASLTAKDNSVIASANAVKASLATESASYTSASNSASNALKLVNASASAANYANSALSTVASGMTSANSSAFINNLVSAFGVNSAAVENVLHVGGIDQAGKLVKLDLVSMASAAGYNVAELKSNASGLKSVASATKAAANGNYSVSNLSSVAGSLAKSAGSALFSANSASATFAKSTDEDGTLASYYASSYSNDASSEAADATNVQSALAAFYTANADAKYASATNALAENNGIAQSKSALAKKLGLDVYATAPKFITITKDGLLHASADYGSANDKKLGKVEAGQQYQVNSIGIANNGAVRYNITVNGQSGYFTNANGYVEPTYYEATPNNRENVKALKTVRLYKDLNRTQYAGKTIAKGDTLSNDVVTAVSVDGNFGGYTVFEDLKSGEFFTSNVKCVSATPVKAANNNNQNNNNNKPVNPVQFF